MTPGWAAWLFPTWIATVITAGIASAFIAYQIAFDRGFEEAVGPKERHRHRHGDPQETTLLELPRAGRLEPLPATRPPHTSMPPTHSDWMFFGDGQQVLPQPGPAEYQLLTAPVMTQTTQTMTVTATTSTTETRTDETPSQWSKRQGLELARDIDAMIAESEQARQELVEESNYFQHMILAGHLSLSGGPGTEAGAEAEVLARTAEGVRHGRHGTHEAGAR